MSTSLAIAANAVADLVMLGGLAYVMSRPSRLTPHGAARQAVAGQVTRLRPMKAAAEPMDLAA